MNQFDGCQLPCIPRLATGSIQSDPQPLKQKAKRLLAYPWNTFVKKWIKALYALEKDWRAKMNSESKPALATGANPIELHTGDRVRVRSLEEIQTTLDPWKELKGCAFLTYMAEYCGTTQRVLKPVERFLDERDYKVKRARGVVLLENVICSGTPVFGRCDRGCHLFWRVEWLEKLEENFTNES